MNSTNNNDNRDGGATTWLSAAREEIRRTASPRPNDELYGILRAFGDSDDDAPGPSNLDPDDGGASSSDVLRDRISAELLDEVDADQAMMFGRRFCSVSTLLLRGGDEKDGGGRAGAMTATTWGEVTRISDTNSAPPRAPSTTEPRTTATSSSTRLKAA